MIKIIQETGVILLLGILPILMMPISFILPLACFDGLRTGVGRVLIENCEGSGWTHPSPTFWGIVFIVLFWLIIVTLLIKLIKKRKSPKTWLIASSIFLIVIILQILVSMISSHIANTYERPQNYYDKLWLE